MEAKRNEGTRKPDTFGAAVCGTQMYGAVDCFRLLAAFLVVAIHTSPLMSFSADADFFLTRVLARVAVPFFFMASGQFVAARFTAARTAAPSLRSASQSAPSLSASQNAPAICTSHSEATALWRAVKKLCLLYGASILLYLPVGIYAGHYDHLTPFAALRLLVFDGTFYHLWYFPACIIGLLLLFLMSRRLPLSAMFAVCALLYLAGVVGDSYYGFLPEGSPLHQIYDCAFRFFSYTRNGLFFAPIFLLLGAWLGGLSERHQAAGETRRREIALCAIGFFGFLILMTVEAFTLRQLGVMRHDSMYLTLVPLMLFLYRLLLLLRAPSHPLLRSAATFLYILHPAAVIAVRAAAKLFHLVPLLVEQSLVHYLCVSLLSAAAAFLLAFLLQKRKQRKAAQNSDQTGQGRYRS